MRRKRWSEIEAGDSIASVPADPGNGRLWSGTVTKVTEFMSQALVGVPSRPMVQVTVEVEGRSLCAEDLVHGFGHRTRTDAFQAPTYTLSYPRDAALFRKVNHRGLIVWDGYRVEAAR